MRILLLIVAAVISLGAGYAALTSFGGEQEAINQPQLATAEQPRQEIAVDAATVLVAKDDIAIGTIVTQDMVDMQKMQRNLVPDSFIVEGTPAAEKLVGSITRASFRKAEPFTPSKLGALDEAGFLAADLPSGKRAMTLKIDAISGVAGYVFPGDRVDLLTTREVPGSVSTAGITPSGRATASEVIAANVLVMAINTRGPVANDKNQPSPVPANITVEVDPMQAQQVRVAERNGELSLILRSLKDNKDYTISGTTHSGTPVRIVRGIGRDTDSLLMVPSTDMEQQKSDTLDVSDDK